MRREQLPDCLEVDAALLSPEARKGVSAVRMNALCQRAKKDAPDGSAARRPGAPIQIRGYGQHLWSTFSAGHCAGLTVTSAIETLTAQDRASP
jgi:hypothetical protein